VIQDFSLRKKDFVFYFLGIVAQTPIKCNVETADNLEVVFF